MTSPTYHSVTMIVSAESVELVYSKLYDHHCAGIVEEEMTNKEGICLKAYFENISSVEDLKTELTRELQGLSRAEIHIHEIGLNANRFEPAPYDPFPLAGPYWVCPPADLWNKTLPQHPLFIRPAAAFGTGRHETTRLVCEALYSLHHPGSLLDVGTGSGLVAILGEKLGLACEALEIAEEAIENARENFFLNGCQIPIERDFSKTGKYTHVVANILTPTLLFLKPSLLNALEPGGLLILSGITAEEKNVVREAFSGLAMIWEKEIGGWYGCVLKCAQSS